MQLLVRPYEHRDRGAVRFICCETGFMGEPVEAFFEGREVFADMWSAYYTDYEPEHCLVAQVEGRVVGYLLGATDTRRQIAVTRRAIIPRIAKNTIATKCFWSLKTQRYIFKAIISAVKGEFKTPDVVSEYPAHLHTNIIAGYRGLGLGKEMMRQWLEHLSSHGASGVHLVTTTYNTRAVSFYEKVGFVELFKVPLSLYEGVIEAPVALLGMGLKLSRFSSM